MNNDERLLERLFVVKTKGRLLLEVGYCSTLHMRKGSGGQLSHGRFWAAAPVAKLFLIFFDGVS